MSCNIVTKLPSFPHLILSARTTRTLSLWFWLPLPSGLWLLFVIRFNCSLLILSLKFLLYAYSSNHLSFFGTKTSTECFFSTMLVALYITVIHKNLITKSFGFNPLPAKPKHIQSTAHPSFSRRLKIKRNLMDAANCTFMKQKTKALTMIAKKFQFSYCSKIITTKIVENWMCD